MYLYDYDLEKRGIIRIKGGLVGDISEIVSFLTDIETAYNSLLYFELWFEKLNYHSSDIRFPFSPLRKSTTRNMIPSKNRLVIDKAVFNSPGFWEMVGSLNPLTQIRGYISERYERKYREREWPLIEDSRRLDNIQKRIDILKSMGCPDDEVRILIADTVDKPLSLLSRHIEAGRINGVELLDNDSKVEIPDTISSPNSFTAGSNNYS